MKKLFLLTVLATLCLSFTAKNEPVESTNTLILQGDIDIDEKIDIMVFEFDYSTCNWISKETVTEKKDYHLILNPTKNYQVWFKTPSGRTKILYITKGKECAIRVKMNVDFNNNLQFASLYQEKIAMLITYKLKIESKPIEKDFVYLSK